VYEIPCKLLTNSKNENIRDLYRGIKEFKNVTNLENENGDLIVDSYSVLNIWKNYFCQLLMYMVLGMLSRHKCT
jgi:hypothetical protein